MKAEDSIFLSLQYYRVVTLLDDHFKEFGGGVVHETDIAVGCEGECVVRTILGAIGAVVGGPSAVKGNFELVVASGESERSAGVLAVFTLGSWRWRHIQAASHRGIRPEPGRNRARSPYR
jgi:hypothetical protein